MEISWKMIFAKLALTSMSVDKSAPTSPKQDLTTNVLRLKMSAVQISLFKYGQRWVGGAFSAQH
jgi:hypothetical protein